jgi:hypothetical protein
MTTSNSKEREPQDGCKRAGGEAGLEADRQADERHQPRGDRQLK